MINIKKYFVISLYALVLLYCALSYPQQFMPDDLYIHLSVISQWISHGNPYLFDPQHQFIRPSWHFIWATIFNVLDIKNVNEYPIIIYRIQEVITFTCVSFAAGLLLKIIKKNVLLIDTFIVGWFSGVLFFLGTGVLFESWFVRYGCTYQITLPFSFVVSVCSMKMLINRKLYVYDCAIVSILSFCIIKFHAMELLYTMIFIFITLLFYYDKFKKKFYIYFISGVIVLFSILTFIPDIKRKINFSFNSDYIFNYQRFVECISGFIISSLVISIILIIAVIRRNKRSISECDDIKPLFCIYIYSLAMVLIPLPIVSNLFRFMPNYDMFRFYFGSAWFLLLPVILFIYFDSINKFTGVLLGYIFVVLLSSYYLPFNHVSFNNFKSLQISISYNKLTNWNHENLKVVKSYMLNSNYSNKSHTIFIARSDISLMINLLGGFTTFSDVHVNKNGNMVGVVRKTNINYKLPSGYKFESVPDLFPVDEGLKNWLVN